MEQTKLEKAKQEVLNSMDAYSDAIIELSKSIDALDNPEMASQLGKTAKAVQKLITSFHVHRNEMFASHGFEPVNN